MISVTPRCHHACIPDFFVYIQCVSVVQQSFIITYIVTQGTQGLSCTGHIVSTSSVL